MIIQHNLAAINTMRQFGINTDNLKKSAERLGSGYRINRAADDASTLAISEKKRTQIRGLIRASKNAEDGIGIVKTADGAMDQMANILQRMRELSIQSLNDIYLDEDRALMQLEFDQLQSEIDATNNQTEFNKKTVFEHYPETYFSFQGNKYWSQDQIHKIDDTNNSLTVTYQITKEEPAKVITLEVPKGEYTTQELMDEIDDVVTALGEAADGLVLEYTDEHCCNLVLQNGEKITEVAGGLSYLFFDEFEGTQVGQLIGTTVFVPGSPLYIDENNNELKFTIENFDGTTQDVDLEIPKGNYSRQEMIDYLNNALTGTGLTATEYGESFIQIGGEDGVITGLKGNMFKIDNEEEGEDIRTSVFYDNTKYGSVTKTPAIFKGGAVLVTNAKDTENNRFHIDSTNNTLKVRVNSDTYQDIILEEKDYAIIEMMDELQKKLDEKGLEVKVDRFTETLRTTNGNTLTFGGLRLTSKETGTDSVIEFDVQGSSAYKTLFVERTYTDFANKISTTNGSYTYKEPTLTGGKTYQSTDFPLTLDSTNNKFQLRVTEEVPSGTSTATSSATYTITLEARQYASLDDILLELNEQLNGENASSGIKGKIQVIDKNGAISFDAVSETITAMTFYGTGVSSYAQGYQTLFVGEKITFSTSSITSSGKAPSVTLDKLEEPIVIDATNNKFNVNVGGTNRPVTLEPGEYTKDEFAEALTEQLKGTSSTYANTFSASDTGETTDKNRTFSTSGKTTTSSFSCNVMGTGGVTQGSTQVADGTPASYTVPVALKSSTTVGAENDELVITSGGHVYSIYLEHKSYTPAELAAAIQEELNEVTSESDKVKVTLNNSNQLVFTTALETKQASLQFGSGTSTLLNSIVTTKTAASMTVSVPLQSTISIDSSSNTFKGTWKGNAYSVTLASNDYTPAEFAEELTKKLQDKGIGVKATVNGSYLNLITTEAEGNDSTLGFNTRDCGTAGEAMFGELITKTPAKAVLNRSLQNTITMKEGENIFTTKLTEGGVEKDVSITIPKGDYTREELVEKMNELYDGEISVTMNSATGVLTFTTAAAGSDVALRLNNSISGSAGTAMFGETTVKTPDITASFDENGNLVLKGENSTTTYSLSVTPSTGSPVAQPKPVITKVNPTSTSGDVSLSYFTLKSTAALPTSIPIESYNKDFRFIYTSPSGDVSVDISLEEKDYSRGELQSVLQDKIDEVLGEDKLVVSVASTGITIRAAKYSNSYSMSGMSGGFYDYVMKGTAVRSSFQEVNYQAGSKAVSDTYIIGRKDVRNEVCKIQEGVSDELSLDVTIDNQMYTLSMKLEPGEYGAQALVNHIQQKLNEQVQAAGLPGNAIGVQIGGYESGVIGSDDANALTFFLNKDADLEPGNYKIDGLKGSALFEIFYKTTGELVPAYVTGTKDVSEGVEILLGETEFSVDVDGETYTYEIPEGEYTAEELIDKLNELFDQPDVSGKTALINASQSGNAIKISYNKVGKHKVTNLQGAAKPALFYEMEGRKEYESDNVLQIGANAGQFIELERYCMSTVAMGINSVTISKWKYANKALVRIDDALNYLTSRRSLYGAKQNRLEYTVKGNDIAAENLQDSESRDRDTDMADEMVQYSRSKILQQASMAMLAQAKEQGVAVLSLLE